MEIETNSLKYKNKNKKNDKMTKLVKHFLYEKKKKKKTNRKIEILSISLNVCNHDREMTEIKF